MVSLKNQYAISPNIPRFAITLAAATAIGVGSGLYRLVIALRDGLPLSPAHNRDLMAGSTIIDATFLAATLAFFVYAAFVCVAKGQHQQHLWRWAHPYPETNPLTVRFHQWLVFLLCGFVAFSVAVSYQKEQLPWIFVGMLFLPAILFGVEHREVRTVDSYPVTEGGHIVLNQERIKYRRAQRETDT